MFMNVVLLDNMELHFLLFNLQFPFDKDAHIMIPLENYYEYTSSIEIEPLPNMDDMDHSTSEWKIAAFSSAAPRALGQSVTVMDADMTVLREGTNGWTCIPSNPNGPSGKNGTWASAHDAAPLCADDEGFQWIQAYLEGTENTASRDVIMYMLQGDMGEDNTKPGVSIESEAEPGNWIESGSHVMLMPKDTSTLGSFSTDQVNHTQCLQTICMRTQWCL
jgi:hypothetical protein